MTKRTFRAFIGMGALAAAASSSWGCVADRPSRNGVFNENQYLRKDFIIQPGDGTGTDTGWMMKATITAASQPNPLGNLDLFVGAENQGSLVRFQVTQDHLNLLSMRELDDNSNAAQGRASPRSRTPGRLRTSTSSTKSTSTARRRTSTKRTRSSTGKFGNG